jgi:hypothetical protein
MILTNSTGTIILVNPAAELGYTVEELIVNCGGFDSLQVRQ